MRTLSTNGAAMIAGHEGKSNRLYNDPVGHCTIGIGHLVHRGNCNGSEPESFRRGLSDEEVYDLFIRDAKRFIDAVNRLITVPLSQNQFDALVSFTFNLGEGALEESTLRRKLNAGDYAGAANEFGRWVKADGEVLPGLVRRRREEAELFLTPDDDTEKDDDPMAADLEHLHPTFRDRVLAANKQFGTSVLSGARSTERQRQLYQDFQAGRGNPANPPNTSWHEYGPGLTGGEWAMAVDFNKPYPHGAPGIIFPIKGEPWHGQPSEIPQSARVAGAEKRLPLLAQSQAEEVDVPFSKSPVAAAHLISMLGGHRLLTATGSKQGSKVVIRAADGSLGQRWMLYGHKDGTVSFVSRDGERALDVPDNRGVNGQTLQVHDFVANAAQRFTIKEVQTGVGLIIHVASGRALDIYGAEDRDEAAVGLWDAHGLDNQRWLGAITR